MSSARPLLLFFLAISASHAGLLDNVPSDASDFFNKGFSSVKDLFPTTFQDLDKNINRVKDLLVTIKEKAKMLEPMANDAQKETLHKVDAFLAEVTGFQKEVVQEGEQKFDENKSKWQSMVKDLFEKQGLADLTKLVTKTQAANQFSIVAAIPVIIALIY